MRIKGVAFRDRTKPHSSYGLMGLAVGFLALLAIATHIRFLWAMPDPFFSPDSTAYLNPVFSFFYRGIWDFGTEKPLGYSSFLIVILGTFRHFFPLLCIQHGLWLMTALVAAVLYYQQFNPSTPEAGIVFSLVALLPRGVVYSHQILSEVPFTCVAIASLYLFLSAAKRRRGNLWVLAGGLLGIALLIRPVGRAWAFGLLVTLVLYSRRVNIRREGALFLAAFFLTLTPVCVYNYWTLGFFGTEKVAGIDLFINAAPFVEFSHIQNKIVKESLRPFYATSESRARLTDTKWVYSYPDGPIQTLRRLPPQSVDVEHVLLMLSLRTIASHPFKLFAEQARRFIQFQLFSSRRPEGSISKERTALIGFETFDEMTSPYPQARRFVFFKPQSLASYEKWMYDHPVYPYEPGPFPFLLVWPYVWAVGIIPGLALGLTFFIWRQKEMQFQLATFWAVIASHILLSNLAAGPIQIRYAVPLEPLYIILVVMGAGRCFSRIKLWRDRKS